MKKLIIILLLIVIAANPACKSRKNISKSVAKIDSAQVVKDAAVVRSAHVDSNLDKLLNVYVNRSSENELFVDKIKKTTETTMPERLSFTLNVDAIKRDGDTLVATDQYTGTQAFVYKDQNGVMKFDVKPKGSRRETFELSGLQLKAKNNIDSSATSYDRSRMNSSVVDSSVIKSDSTTVNKTESTINKKIKRSVPVMYIISAIVLIIVLINLLAYIFRNQHPAAAWVWKKVFRR